MSVLVARSVYVIFGIGNGAFNRVDAAELESRHLAAAFPEDFAFGRSTGRPSESATYP